MIRYLEQNEKQNIRDLYEECFADSKALTDYYFTNRLPNNFVAVNEKDGQLVSALHLIPKTAVIGKLKSRVMYIYGVGTKQYARGEGCMRDLMNTVIKDMYQDMEAFTYIIPTDQTNANAFRKFGFEFVMDKPFTKPMENWKKATHSLILRKADHSDLVRLSIFAKSNTESKYKVTLSKDADYFKELAELIELEGGEIEIYVENKVIMGYRVWIDNKIYEEVLDPSIQSMSYYENEGRPYLMARIMSVRKTLRMLGFYGNGSVIIRISDPVIEENNGTFRFTYHHGSVKMDRLDDDVMPEIDVTIGELTAHIFGYNQIEGLPSVAEKSTVFINDYI